MTHTPQILLSNDVAEHLLTAIDNAIPTNPTPQDMKLLCDAYGQVSSHMPTSAQLNAPGTHGRSRGRAHTS